MNGKVCGWKKAVLFLCLSAWLGCITALADGLSGDNSLSSLGIQVEGAVVTPEFEYSTIEYNVTVPAGTQEMTVDPVTSNPTAEIISITGQELTDGEGTVVITVRAENGSECSYYLYVTAQAAAQEPEAQPVTEKETQPPTEKETEPETEDPRYVRVDRNSLEEAEKTIETLKTETASYRDRLKLLMKILYGMIAFCVVLLFVVINLILKKKDLKAELRDYAEYGYFPENGGGPFPEGDMGLGEAVYDEYGAPANDVPSEEYMPENGREENYDRSYEEYEEYGMNGEAVPEEPVIQEEDRPEEIQPEKMPQGEERQPENEKDDDPAEVPRASKAKRRHRKMPEYKESQPAPEYQPSGRRSGKKDVEVTMIDL